MRRVGWTWGSFGKRVSAGGTPSSPIVRRRAQPDFAQAHNNLGSVLNTQRRWKEAEAACRRAIALDAQLAEAHNNLGIALKAQGRLAESEVALRQALALLPDLAQIEANLAAVLRDQCRMNEASSHAWRAIELGLDDPRFHSYALSGEQYLPGVTPQRLAVLHAEWDRRHAAPLKRAWRPFSRDRDPQAPCGWASSRATSGNIRSDCSPYGRSKA